MWKTLAVALVAATLLAPTTASALENEELLALVAMPLAVATVSEITDVPVNELIDVVTMLNNAAVPPQQFVEVVRYIPVALVEEEAEFVDFMRLREQEGVVGTALVTSIAERLRVYGLPEVDLAVTRPRTIDVVEDEFLPRPVRTRLAERKTHPAHPHGGPPGQLKKAAGTRVVAEVVDNDDHRRLVTDKRSAGKADKAGKADRPRREVKKARVRDLEPQRRVVVARDHDRGNGSGNGKAKNRGERGNGKGNGNSGNGNGKAKGKG